MTIPDWMIDAPAASVDDLAALVRQLVHSLRKAAPGNDLSDRAVDYLTRHGLQGLPLRAEVPAHEPSSKLMELADKIDHEQLWRWAGMDRDKMTAEQRDRMLAGVQLRRYADLLGNDGWRIYPPRPGFCLRAGSLDEAVAMAKRDEARRAES